MELDLYTVAEDVLTVCSVMQGENGLRPVSVIAIHKAEMWLLIQT